MAVGRVHLRPPRRPWGDVVSEGQTQVSIARTRAGIDMAERGADEPAAALVAPESAAAPAPVSSGARALDRRLGHRRGDRACRPGRRHGPGAADGLDRRPRDDRRRGRGDPGPGDSTGAIRVELLPTYIGCPALDIIRAAITDRLAALGLPVVVETTFNPPWTTDRVTAAGRAALNAAGIAEPSAPADVRCPYCRSVRIVIDSAFGPTQCRSLYYCRDCRQPFEAMKLV